MSGEPGTGPIPGQVWKTSSLTISILSIRGGRVWFETSRHPQQSLREGELLSWLRGIGATLQEDVAPQRPTDPMDMPLPCEIRIGHIRFNKGVSLRTFVDAATRWHATASKTIPTPAPEAVEDFHRSIAALGSGDIEDGFIRDSYDD